MSLKESFELKGDEFIFLSPANQSVFNNAESKMLIPEQLMNVISQGIIAGKNFRQLFDETKEKVENRSEKILFDTGLYKDDDLYSLLTRVPHCTLAHDLDLAKFLYYSSFIKGADSEIYDLLLKDLEMLLLAQYIVLHDDNCHNIEVFVLCLNNLNYHYLAKFEQARIRFAKGKDSFYLKRKGELLFKAIHSSFHDVFPLMIVSLRDLFKDTHDRIWQNISNAKFDDDNFIHIKRLYFVTEILKITGPSGRNLYISSFNTGENRGLGLAFKDAFSDDNQPSLSVEAINDMENYLGIEFECVENLPTGHVWLGLSAENVPATNI